MTWGTAQHRQEPAPSPSLISVYSNLVLSSYHKSSTSFQGFIMHVA